MPKLDFLYFESGINVDSKYNRDHAEFAYLYKSLF